MICKLCERDMESEMVEKHHLNPYNRKGDTIDVCCHCGDQIHLLFSRKELRDKYFTLDKLLESDKIQKWIKWVRKKNPVHVCMKVKKKK